MQTKNEKDASKLLQRPGPLHPLMQQLVTSSEGWGSAGSGTANAPERIKSSSTATRMNLLKRVNR